MMGSIERLEDRRLFSSLLPGFVEQSVVTGLSRPVAMSVLPDGRWLVTEQAGKLRVVQNGSLLASPALTLNVDSNSERGLLGLAIDPNFNSNKYVYLYYTHKPDATTRYNRVSRFTLNGNTVVGGSEQVLLQLETLSSAGNHNGGALHFGTDGKLYIAVGDNAAPTQSPLLTSLNGKMLRINADGSIPSDNPFYNTLSGKYRAIWSYGLRNPFSFAVQPNSGQIFINDVGQKAFEEINLARAGANYGWPASEGPTNDPAFDAPLYAYGREVGQAITGGVFYSPSTLQFPTSYANDYFLGDHSAGWIKSLDPVTKTFSDFATNVVGPVDFDVLPDGSLLYLSYAGSIHQIRYDPDAPPAIVTQPPDRVATVGQQVTFQVEASGPMVLSFQWYRDDLPVNGATEPAYTLNAVSAADDGAEFFVRVTSGNETLNSRTATLNVDTQNTAPVPTISKPGNQSLFRAGESIAFAGSAFDSQDGTLAASRLDWKIEYITGAVVRPLEEFSGTAGSSFKVPIITPYTQTDVKYRITLIARDSKGAIGATSVDILPRYSTLKLSSTGAAVPILLDGQPQTSPAQVLSVEGLQRTIEAPSTYEINGVTYYFQSWSDGGPRLQLISVPIDDLTLVATYATTPPAANQVVEAELATLSGGTVWAQGWDGYTGPGYADYAGQGSAAQFAINRTAPGTATLQFRYANGSSANRPLQVVVNNVAVGTINCPNTGGWDQWLIASVGGVSLPAGAVTIRAVASTSAGGANLDSLTIVPSDTEPPPPPPPPLADVTLLEAESATLSGGTYKGASKKGYTGSGYADFAGQGSAIQFSLNRASAATVALQFRYANGSGNRPLQVLVNNVVVGTLNFPSTGGWDKWATATLSNVPLPAGIVTIRAQASTSAGGANVDSLTIASNDNPDPPPPPPQPPAETGTIGGYAFNDSNRNGIQDGTETRAAGKVVFLDADNDGKRDTGETQKTTDTSGGFSFTGLQAGLYRVRRVFPTGYTYSTLFRDITLTAGQTFSNVTIGSQTTSGAVAPKA